MARECSIPDPVVRADSERVPLPLFRSRIADPLQLLCRRRAEGLRCCLVTLVGLQGTSPRRLGAQLAITEVGEATGSISGGCLDASVLAEAMHCLHEGRSRRVRYGAGSPYIDLALPCGSGLDLQFDGAIHADTLIGIHDCLTHRRLIDLSWTSAAQPPDLLADDACADAHSDGSAHVRIAPRLRVFVAGNGENLRAFCRIARAGEVEVIALHPDRDADAWLRGLDLHTHLLQSPLMLPALTWDAFSAAITLFHDHQWEVPFLLQALQSDAFMVGAMGSQRAHALRVEQLREHGAGEQAIGRLRGPIGMLPRAREPEELAISVLGELMQCYRQQCARYGVAA